MCTLYPNLKSTCIRLCKYISMYTSLGEYTRIVLCNVCICAMHMPCYCVAYTVLKASRDKRISVPVTERSHVHEWYMYHIQCMYIHTIINTCTVCRHGTFAVNVLVAYTGSVVPVLNFCILANTYVCVLQLSQLKIFGHKLHQ